jgi:hypothetical protein
MQQRLVGVSCELPPQPAGLDPVADAYSRWISTLNGSSTPGFGGRWYPGGVSLRNPPRMVLRDNPRRTRELLDRLAANEVLTP